MLIIHQLLNLFIHMFVVAVLSLNVGLTGGHAQRNVATARALLPAMMCHIAEAIGNIACSSMPMKDQAKVASQ